MPAWITLAVSDLNALMLAEQLDALRSEALAPGQADPFTEIAPAIIAKVRAYIASNPENKVDANVLTIPPELKIDVGYLILAPMMIRLSQPLSKDQEKQVEIAHSTLIALREKKLVVSKPDDAVAPDVQGGDGVELASSTTRQVTREKLSGL